MSNLLFDRPASNSGDLLFGDDGAPPPAQDVPVTIAAALLPPQVDVHPYVAQPARVLAVLPAPMLAAAAQYVSGAARPTVGEIGSAWQAGHAIDAGAQARHQWAIPSAHASASRWQPAAPLAHATAARHQQALHIGTRRAAAWENGRPLHPAPLQQRWQETVRDRRPMVAAHWQQALRLSQIKSLRWQDTLHLRRGSVAAWQKGAAVSASSSDTVRTGQRVSQLSRQRHQEAMRPPPGIWRRPAVPPRDLCYLPSGELLFTLPWEAGGGLIFICERHGGPVAPGATVVVPILEVYFVTNDATLRRVDGNIPLPVIDMSLRLDVDSWTWGFTASLPGRTLADLEPASYGEPVELEAVINGVAYRVLAEGIRRERSFGRSAISVSGRGRNAVLDAPYAPVRHFANAQARTAQQLAADVLTINGVNNGWSIDWQPEDWLVPAGAWAHQGTHISALSAIAGALGGYIQPHRVDAALAVLARYPLAPWDWPAATPDFQLPADVTTREAIEWIDRPAYNRVYVSGVGAGVLGQVTRAGTAGDLIAPMAADPLITAEPAARQRGLSILADVGRQARIDLSLPVLPETGIIVPGKLVRYTDAGATRIGMVRGTQVAVGFPVIRQTLTVETHVNA